MVFSSVIFLFWFLPAVLILHFLLPQKLRNGALALASLTFYFWGEGYLVWIILASILTDYIAGLVIAQARNGTAIRQLEPGTARSIAQKAALLASLTVNLGLLIYFKYSYFCIENYNVFIGQVGATHLRLGEIGWITLPLGISFYTFQTLSYSIDVYRGHVKATRNFFDFACFVSMFPQLVAGPIVRYGDLAPQLTHRSQHREELASGIRRFIIGLAKKVLIADTVAKIADAIFEIPAHELTSSLAWLGIVSYSLQIYFDFSGYSDMAIGLGKMFGFNLPENFNYPYLARSMKDFWRRWHISLSTWFRDYVYISLGGNRKSALRTHINLLAVFFLCGLWHGADWNFVAWGLFHGFFLILERTRVGDLLSRLPRPLQHSYVLLIVAMTWVPFRAESFPHAIAYFSAMAGFGAPHSTSYPNAMYLRPDIVLAIVLGVIGSTDLVRRLANWTEQSAHATGSRVVVFLTQYGIMATIFLLSVASLSSRSHHPFIYFRF